jgi:hypothetical protein
MSYDPRIAIRNTIGTLYAIKKGSWDEQRCIRVTDNFGNRLYLPIYLAEEVNSKDLPSMPFISIHMREVQYTPHDIRARTRKHEAYYDVGVWFTATDNIDTTTFGKVIVDEIQHQIRSRQENCGFSDCPINFMTVESVRYLEQTQGAQVVYHYVVEVYCIYYD